MTARMTQRDWQPARSSWTRDKSDATRCDKAIADQKRETARLTRKAIATITFDDCARTGKRPDPDTVYALLGPADGKAYRAMVTARREAKKAARRAAKL